MPGERLLMGGMAVTLHALNDLEKAKELWEGLLKTDRRYKDARWVGEQLLWPRPLIAEAEKLISKL